MPERIEHVSQAPPQPAQSGQDSLEGYATSDGYSLVLSLADLTWRHAIRIGDGHGRPRVLKQVLWPPVPVLPEKLHRLYTTGKRQVNQLGNQGFTRALAAPLLPHSLEHQGAYASNVRRESALAIDVPWP